MDYTKSHLDKGGDYDSNLQNEPLSAYMTRMETRILDKIIPRYFPAGIDRYLDFACGTGRITNIISKFAQKSYGVDVSESMQSQAKIRCPEVEFVLQNIIENPLEVEPLSMISSFRFFGNADDGLRHKVLKTLNSLLVNDGLLIINNHRNPGSVYNRLRRLDGQNIDLDLTYGKLKEMLKTHGFELVKAYGIGFWLFRSAWMQHHILNSGFAKMIEPLSRLPFLAPYCVDVVIVAKKTKASA